MISDNVPDDFSVEDYRKLSEVMTAISGTTLDFDPDMGHASDDIVASAYEAFKRCNEELGERQMDVSGLEVERSDDIRIDSCLNGTQAGKAWARVNVDDKCHDGESHDAMTPDGYAFANGIENACDWEMLDAMGAKISKLRTRGVDCEAGFLDAVASIPENDSPKL